MDLNQLPDTATLLQYFNYGIIAFVAFFAIIGFFRGTYKSIFYLIATTIILVGGWFVMDTASVALLNFDLTSYNLILMEVPVTSLNQFVHDIAVSNFPGITGLLTQDTYVASLVSGLLVMVVRLVYFIGIVVISFTIFKLFTDILWLFFKPKKRNSYGKKKRKSFLSRLGGFGIGAVKGALYLLLLCFPLAGIASIGESLSQVVYHDPDNTSYQLVLLGNSATLVADEPTPSSGLGDLEKIFDILGIYRESSAGKVFGSVKVGGASVDEYVFDSLLSFDIEENKVAIREELQIVANALAKMDGLMTQELTFEALIAQDPAVLKTFIDDISELNILKVIIPIGLEVAILYEDEEGNTLLDQLGDIDITLEDIHSTNYSTDIKNLGYVFVDVTQIYDFTEGTTNNFLDLDPTTVSSIFDSVGSLGIVDLIAPIGVTYVTTMPEISNALLEYGVNVDDLGLGDISDWGAEISKFGDIYEAFHAFQITDFAAFSADDADYATLLQYVTENNMNAFTTALFDSLILQNATPVIMGTLITTVLPEEYRDTINFDDISWDATEFSALLNASISLLKSGLLNMTTGTPDLSKLDEEAVNDLAKYLSQSNAITSNLNGLIQLILNGSGIFGEMDIEFILLQEDEWTEVELCSIFNAARVLATADLTQFDLIEDTTIDDLALYLSGSKFIRLNLNPIIDYFLETADLFGDTTIEFISLDTADWTETELGNLFHAAKILATTDFADFGVITNDTIDDLAAYLSGSKFITSNLNPILDVFLEDMNLFGDTTIEFVELDVADWTQAELGNLFHAAKLLTTTDFTDFSSVEDSTINDLATYLSGSQFITSNLNPILDVFLDDMNLFGDTTIDFVELETSEWTEIELSSLFHAAKLLTTTDFTDFGAVEDSTIDDLADYLSGSQFITSNLNPILDVFLDDMNLFGDSTIEFIELDVADWTQGELSNLFHAAKLLSSTDFTNFGTIEDATIDDLALYLSGSQFITSNLNPILDVFLDDMNLFGDSTIEFAELDVTDWTEMELSSLFNAAKLLSTTDFTNFGAVEDATIDQLAIHLSSSKLITHSLNPILDVYLEDMNLFGDTTIEFIDLAVDDWTQGELSSLFHAAKLLSTTDFSNFDLVEDTTIDDLAQYLSGSKFITSNLNPILDVYLEDMNLFGDANIDFVDLETSEWTEIELSSLFYAAKLLSTTDFSNFGAVEDATIDDLAYYLSRSKFITYSLNPILDVYLDDMDLFGDTTIDFVELNATEWTEAELTHLFYSAKLLSTQDMANIATLSNEVIADMSYHMANSLFITRNLNPLIDSFLEDMDSGSMDLEFGTVDDWSDPVAAEVELNAIFKSAKIISNNGNSTDAFLNLTEEELDIFLSSELISETLVNVLKSTSEPGRELDFLVGVNDPDVPWYDTNQVNTTFTITGTIMTITAPVNTTKFDIYADGEKVASTRNLTYDLSTIVLGNPSPVWTVNAFNEGELRKIFTAMGALASSLGGEGGFTTDTITTLSDQDIDNIIVSDILVQSIVVLLEDMANEANPFIVIPEGDLKSMDSAVKLAAWKNSGTEGIVIEGELSKLFKGLRHFLQGNTIESFSMTTITGLSDDDIYEMLKSDVLSESIIVQIEAQADPLDPSSVIAIPTLVGLDDPNDRSAWHNVYQLDGDGRYMYDEFDHVIVTTDGELTRCLRALKIILNGGDINQIDIGNILDEANQNVVLTSLVIEETIIKKVEDEAAKDGAVITIPYTIEQDRSLWKGEYGELRALLNALDYILGDGGSIESFDFDLNIVISEKDEILKSLVISETIIVKLEEQDSIYIPIGSGYGLVSETDRSAWLNIYSRTVDGNYQYDLNDDVIITTHGELSLLLDAIDIIVPVDPITGDRSLEAISFDISELFAPENRPTFLKSRVISETIVHQIFETATTSSSLYIPGTLYLNAADDATDYNRDQWFNVYSGNVLTFKGEIDYLLDAADLVLGEGASFDTITFDVGIAFDPVNQSTLLRSLVISETMVQKIAEEANAMGSMLTLPGLQYVNDVSLSQNRDKWFNDYSGETVVEHELAHLLNATSKVTSGSDFANLSFDLSAAFDPINQPIVLRSYVISETILQKIVEETNSPTSMLMLPPVGYLEDPTLSDRDTWFNEYDASGNVTKTNELAHLLNASNILLSGGNFDNVTFDLSAAFDTVNQPIILKSYVISETILQKIVEESNSAASMLKLPPLGYLNDPTTSQRDSWYNQYDVDGNLVSSNELAHLLSAANLVLSGGTFENMDFDLSAAFDTTNQPIILRSLVISETIMQRIIDETNNAASMLSLPPSGFLDDPSLSERSTWYNTYNVDGDVVATKEIAHLLNATNILLGGGDFTDVSFDLSAAFDDANQATILKSYIISETILQRIVEETNSPTPPLYLAPSPYLDDVTTAQRMTWYNTYDNEGNLLSKKEIANLLEACQIILGGDSFDNLSSFDISVAFDPTNQAILLKSFVISETLVQSIYQESQTGVFDLPSETYLENPNTSTLRSTWYTTYDNDGNIVATKEISHLLNAAKQILPSGNNFTGMDFNIENLFDQTKQKIVLQSYVFSETIISKIYEQNGITVDVPLKDLEGNILSDVGNRSPWYNQYNGDEVNSYGEIAHMLDATNIILGGSGTFETMAFSMDVIFEDAKQIVVLQSLVLSETIVQKIFDQNDTITSMPLVDLQNRPLQNNADRCAWYNDYSGETVVENELAKFLDSIELIVGEDSFETMGGIDVDSILAINFILVHDAQFDVTNSDFETLVNSVVMENIVAGLVEDIADTVMVDFLTVPADGYHFYKKDLITDYDPTTFNVSLYDLQGFLESLYVMNQSGIDYKILQSANILNFDDNTTTTFSKAMVISRVFKGSIEKMFNTMLQPTYTSMPDQIPVSFMPLVVYNKKAWDDVRFYQINYDGTRLLAYTNLIAKLAALKQTETVSGIDIPIAFYEE